MENEKKILILDDDEMVLKSLEKFLSMYFTVAVFQDEYKAFEYIRENKNELQAKRIFQAYQQPKLLLELCLQQGFQL